MPEIILIIYFAACLAVLILKMTGILRCEYSSILVAALIPVFGMIMLILKSASDRKKDRESLRLEIEHMHAAEEKKSLFTSAEEPDVIPLNEALIVNDTKTRRKMMMDIMYDLNRSIAQDPDDLNDRTVPITEAMVVNDSATRRSLLIDVLYSNPRDYVAQLFEAKSNDDTEIVHYAATALTEIQKNYDIRFQELARKRTQNPDRPGMENEYQALLENYIDSGLLKGDGLTAQLRQLSRLLAKKLERAEAQGKWGLLNKKAETDLMLRDADELAATVKMMQAEWPEEEHTFMYRIFCAALRKDPEEAAHVLSEIRTVKPYVSPELRSVMQFWGGEEGAERAVS